ncbi:hypothetical protein IV102_14355 [bacterium]|nr:hypothetical protein [bacterium]
MAMPILGVALFVYSWAILSHLVDFGGFNARLITWLSRFGMALGLGGVLLVGVACLVGPYRRMAQFSLAYNFTLMLLLVACSEFLIPLPHVPSQAQMLLLEQIRRRNEEFTLPYRTGKMVPGVANSLGWLDRDHTFANTTNRVVFIGDSMLEVRSRRRLALRVEERFAARGNPLEVINLSMAQSDPLDYRFRLHEYAFDYQPSHVFVFLYGPNDFHLGIPYEPYRSPPIRVTQAAVAAAKPMGLPAERIRQMSVLAKNRLVHPDRESFLKAVGGILPPDTRQLLYTLAVAHSDAVPLRFLNSTRSRINNGGNKFADGCCRILKGCGVGGSTVDPRWWNSEEFRRRHEAVFALPREKRLRALVDLFAEFLEIDPEPVWRMLNSQSQEFQSWLTAEQDMMVYLAQPLNRLAGILPDSKPMARRLISERADMYTHLLCEMQETARVRGCKLTFVFIPSPQAVDQDWVKFWGKIMPVDPYIPLFNEVLRRMKGRASCLDLGSYPDRMRGAYWQFDGHWTELGNEAVADILCDFLQK